MNTTSNAGYRTAKASPLANPWVQLIIGIICMACVANLQYGWTLFVNPIDAKYHWGRSAIQVAFTIFVLIETWLVPVEGYLVDRFGPRWVVHRRRHSGRHRLGDQFGRRLAAGAVFRGRASAVSAPAASTALASATRSSGSRAAAVSPPASRPRDSARAPRSPSIPISHMIKPSGYEQAFLVFGLLQGGIVFVMGWLLLVPPPSILNAAGQAQTDRARVHALAKCCEARCSTCCT